jgi:TRAP-type C4-dicarboxylate transport system permease small subunit
MDAVNLKVCYVAMASTFFLMCMTTVHAILRKFTNLGGITDSLDITILCMVVLVFCSFAFMESQHGHVRVTVLADRFPSRFGAGLHGVLLILTGLFIFIMFYAVAGNITTIMSRGAATLVLKIPFWPFHIVMAVGLFVYALTVVFHGIEKLVDLKAVADEKGADEVKDVDVTTQM